MDAPCTCTYVCFIVNKSIDCCGNQVHKLIVFTRLGGFLGGFFFFLLILEHSLSMDFSYVELVSIAYL